jgi:hypothetical protein
MLEVLWQTARWQPMFLYEITLASGKHFVDRC